MDFDCIYKSYYLDVYHFLCGLSSNKEIAEDITQSTFLQLYMYKLKSVGKTDRRHQGIYVVMSAECTGFL